MGDAADVKTERYVRPLSAESAWVYMHLGRTAGHDRREKAEADR